MPRATPVQVAACEAASEAKLEAIDKGSYWFIEPKKEYREGKWVTYNVDKTSGLPTEIKLTQD